MDVFFAALEAALDAKKQTAPQSAKPPQPPPEDPRAAARRARTAAAAPAAAPPAPSPHPRQTDGGLLPLFEDGKSLIRALIAAEVLGPPVAMREPSPWSQPPNERSI